MVLYLQVKKDSKSAELVFDNEGLSLFSKIINKEWREPIQLNSMAFDIDHEHLLSKSYGGQELTPEHTSNDFTAIESLKVVYIGKEDNS